MFASRQSRSIHLVSCLCFIAACSARGGFEESAAGDTRTGGDTQGGDPQTGDSAPRCTPQECDDANPCNGLETCDPAFGCRRGDPIGSGRLDPSFGTNGIQILDFGGVDQPKEIAVLPNGAIRVALQTNSFGTNNDFALVALQPDGELDLEFGTGGVGLLAQAGAQSVFGMAVGESREIILSGQTFVGPTTDAALVRFLLSGDIDRSWPNSGFSTFALTANDDVIRAVVALRGTGDFFGAGHFGVGGTAEGFLARFTANGNLDNSFGTSGIVSVNIPQVPRVEDLEISGDFIYVGGRGFVSGGNLNDFFVARFALDGAPDPNFNSGTPLLVDVGTAAGGGPTDDIFADLAVDPLGGVIVVGQAIETPDVEESVGIVRMSATGAVSFARTVVLSGGADRGFAVRIDGEGHYIVASVRDQTAAAVEPEWVLLRFNLNDNTTDSEFGTGGISPLDLADGNNLETLRGLTFDAEGRILVTGWFQQGTLDGAVARFCP